MLEEEGEEGWKEVRRKKEEGGLREERRRRRWLEEREERIKGKEDGERKKPKRS